MQPFTIRSPTPLLLIAMALLLSPSKHPNAAGSAAAVGGPSIFPPSPAHSTQQSRSPSTEPPHSRHQHHPTAQEVITALNLIPNPEKGYFTETFRDVDNITTSADVSRSASTAIYYLLEGSAGDSVWHRVDAAEVWHFYAGAPLTLTLSRDDGSAPERFVLGQDVVGGRQRPQVVVPKRVWQSARCGGDWTLVGTTVAPGFIETGVELAPEGWVPSGV